VRGRPVRPPPFGRGRRYAHGSSDRRLPCRLRDMARKRRWDQVPAQLCGQGEHSGCKPHLAATYANRPTGHWRCAPACPALCGAMTRRCKRRRVVAGENIADERRHHGPCALPVATPKGGNMGIQSLRASTITRQKRACTNPAADPKARPAPAGPARSKKAPNAATHRC